MRYRITAGVALTVLAALATLLGAAPAWAGQVFVHVTPSTVPAGEHVKITASCRDNWSSAKVESPAFGTVTLHPRDGLLTASVEVPKHTRPGEYRVKLSCPDHRSATTSLHVVESGHPKHGPATGFGGGAGAGGDVVPGNWLLTGGLAAVVAGVVLAGAAVRNRRAAGAR
ncbi:hypothetical protein [Micromonospora echinofusca]|uniref:MYXO-CTERM domain-containing protein n=1 Tax=Micromonospora echinofusca TaxID=47858 RepID=A0ABS3VWN7_MICEH|nr:hypothetical protein [Micromonospora echinofusca]MBO4208957.1 hypothetical protein [Micromonospora echinofusca]